VIYHLISNPVSYQLSFIGRQPSLIAWASGQIFDRLDWCTPIYRLYNTHHSYQKVHYQIITSNAVLPLSHSLFLNSNELQSSWVTSVLVIILQYSDAY